MGQGRWSCQQCDLKAGGFHDFERLLASTYPENILKLLTKRTSIEGMD